MVAGATTHLKTSESVSASFLVAVRCREIHPEEVELARLKHPHRRDLGFRSVVIHSEVGSSSSSSSLRSSSAVSHSPGGDQVLSLFDPDEISILQAPTSSSQPLQCGERRFSFSHLLGPTATNRDVYRVAVAPLVQQVLRGFHATCFAYGMTGSGKSHTMVGRESFSKSHAAGGRGGNHEEQDEGDSEAKGMYFLAAQALLERTGVWKGSATSSSDSHNATAAFDEENYVSVIYLELYNEKLRDLLRSPLSSASSSASSAVHASSSSRASTPSSRTSSPHGMSASVRSSFAGSTARGVPKAATAAAPGMQEKEPEVLEDPERGVYVTGATEVRVRSITHLRELLNLGNARRTKAATNSNAASSRSHAILQFAVNRQQEEVLPPHSVGPVGNNHHKGSKKRCAFAGKLSLVDLAGSERAPMSWYPSASVSGGSGTFGLAELKRGGTALQREQEANDRRREGANINRSLLALGNCINALGSASAATLNGPSSSVGAPQHIPYRDSKLTRLLQESLGGNTLTAMIATISPSCLFFEETVSTLKYATRAKAIRHVVTPHIVVAPPTTIAAVPSPVPVAAPPVSTAVPSVNASRVVPASSTHQLASELSSFQKGARPTANATSDDHALSRFGAARVGELRSHGQDTPEEPSSRYEWISRADRSPPSHNHDAAVESTSTLQAEVDRLRRQVQVMAQTNAALRIHHPPVGPSSSSSAMISTVRRGQVVELADGAQPAQQQVTSMGTKQSLQTAEAAMNRRSSSVVDDEDEHETRVLQRCYELEAKLLQRLEKEGKPTARVPASAVLVDRQVNATDSACNPQRAKQLGSVAPVVHPSRETRRPIDPYLSMPNAVVNGTQHSHRTVQELLRHVHEEELRKQRQVDVFLGLSS